MINYQITVYTKGRKLVALDSLKRTLFANVDGIEQKDVDELIQEFILGYLWRAVKPVLVRSGEGQYKNLGRPFPSKLWTYEVINPDGSNLQHAPLEKEKPFCCLQCDDMYFETLDNMKCLRTMQQVTRAHERPDFCTIGEGE